MFSKRKLFRIALCTTPLIGLLLIVAIIQYSFHEFSPRRNDSVANKSNETFQKANRSDEQLSCRREGLRVLYFVHTAPGNAAKRAVLRRTIGDHQTEAFVNSALVFFVGIAPDLEERRAVDEEASRERDVVVLNFTDTYKNLTLKFLHAARWVSENCNLTSDTTIVKMDDDVLVNVFALSSYVASSAMNLNGIHCLLYDKVKPYRKKGSKWYVSKEQYAPEKYPAYCAGAAYMMRLPVLTLLCEEAAHVPVYWVDDVYVTGILASLARIDMVDIKRYFRFIVSNNTETVRTSTLFVNIGSPNYVYHKVDLLWQSVLRANGSLSPTYRWRVRARHRKALPWLHEWVANLSASAESGALMSH